MPIKHNSKTSSKSISMANSMEPTTSQTKRDWPKMMAHLAYICTGLAIILVFVQLNLYCMRYNRAYNSDVVSAVMMSNGQTYFGRLEKFGPHTLVLFDVYYLQVNNDAADTTADSTDTEAVDPSATDSTSNIKLVKLSDDFYKPNNYLILNRDQVLYWQQLDNSSPIIDAISKYGDETEDATTD